MAEKIISLHIDDTSIRILVTQSKKIIDWVDSPLEPGLIQNGLVIKEADVAAKIQQLFKEKNISKKNVLLGMSGMGCLSRTIMFPTLPKEMLGEAVLREAKKLLPMPVEQLYLSWQLIPAPEGKTQVFLNAIPREAFDVLFKVLHQAGLKVNFVNLKPLLISRMMRAARGVIVDVQATEFDIVVMSEGIPQPFRTIAFSSSTLTWQEKLTAIVSELDRTIKFFNSTSTEKPMLPSVPVFASGDMVNDPELYQALSKASGHPVLPLPLSVPMECPIEFDSNRYMVNISLVLRKKKKAALIVDLNVLPIRYQPKAYPLINIIALTSAAGLAALVVLLAMLNQNTSNDTAELRDRLNITRDLYQQNLSDGNALTQDITALKGNIAEVEASSGILATALGDLEKQTADINNALEVTMSTLGSNISLYSIVYAGDELTISGHSTDEYELLSYQQRLSDSYMFGHVTITSMNRMETGGFDFNLAGNPEKQSGEVISAIETIVNSLPTGVRLTMFNQNSGEFTVSGSASDEYNIIIYIQSLETSGKFDEVSSTSMTRNDIGEMEFTLVLRTGE